MPVIRLAEPFAYFLPPKRNFLEGLELKEVVPGEDWDAPLLPLLTFLGWKPSEEEKNDDLINKSPYDHLKRHLGPQSKYTAKKGLLEDLLIISALVHDQCPKMKLSDDEKAVIKTRVGEEIENCTPGYRIRIQRILTDLNSSKGITGALLKMREELVNNAFEANEGLARDVHVYGRYFHVANANNLGVYQLVENDPYAHSRHDPEIAERLNEFFEKEYTPLAMMLYIQKYLKQTLSDVNGYKGRREQGYSQRELNEIFEFLKDYLCDEGEELDRSAYLISSADYTQVFDLDWPKINRRIWDRLQSCFVWSDPTLKQELSKFLDGLSESAGSCDEEESKDQTQMPSLTFELFHLFPTTQEYLSFLSLFVFNPYQELKQGPDQKQELIRAYLFSPYRDLQENRKEDFLLCARFLIENKRPFLEYASLDEADQKICSDLLFETAKQGDLSLFHLLSKAGTPIESKNYDEAFFCLEAARRGHLYFLKALSDQVNIDVKSKALLLAIQEGEKKPVQVLLELGADPNYRGVNGATPLFLVCDHITQFNRGAELLTLLADHGLDLEVKNQDGDTPLLSFLKMKQYDVALALMGQKNIQMDNRGQNNETALEYAFRINDEYLANNLIYYGADYSSILRKNDCQDSDVYKKVLMYQQEAMHYLSQEHVHDDLLKTIDSSLPKDRRFKKYAFLAAASQNETLLVKRALDLGLDPEIKGPHGETALQLAIKNNALDTAVLLLESGADFSLLSHDENIKEILKIQHEKEKAQLQELRMNEVSLDDFLESPDHVNIHSAHRIILFLAVERGDTALVEKILNRNTKGIHGRNALGHSPFLSAIERGDFSVIQSFLNTKRAREILERDGHKALKIAVQSGKYELALLLIKTADSLGVAGINSEQWLLQAVDTGNEWMIQQLLDGRFNLVSPSENLQRAALERAINVGQIGAAHLLINHMASSNLNVYSFAFETAAQVGQLKLVEDLFNNKEISFKTHQKALHSAIMYGKYDVASFLLQQGFSLRENPDLPGSQSYSLEDMIASGIQNRYLDIAGLLLKSEYSSLFPPLTDYIRLFKLAGPAPGFNDEEIVDLIIKRNSAVDTVNLIHLAMQENALDIVQLLYDKEGRASLDFQTEDGQTPLSLAITVGSLDLVRFLLDKDVEIEEKSKKDGYTPLQRAIQTENLELVKFLLQKGADFEAQSDSCSILAMAMHSAVGNASADKRCANLKLVQFLMEAGAKLDPTTDPKFVFIQAAQQGNLALLKLLLDEGFDPIGNNAFSFIADNAVTDSQVKGLLVEHSSRSMRLANRPHSDENPIDLRFFPCKAHRQLILIMAAKSGHYQLLNEVMRFEFPGRPRVDLNQVDQEGNTALMHAASGAHLDCVQELLQNGADLNVKNRNGESVLSLLPHFSLAVQRLILEEQARQAQYFSAAKRGVLSTASLDCPGDVDCRVAKTGKTALMVAAQAGHKRDVQHLLEEGANLFLKDQAGDTAFTLAIKNGQYETANLLWDNMPPLARQRSRAFLQQIVMTGDQQSQTQLLKERSRKYLPFLKGVLVLAREQQNHCRYYLMDFNKSSMYPSVHIPPKTTASAPGSALEERKDDHVIPTPAHTVPKGARLLSVFKALKLPKSGQKNINPPQHTPKKNGT